MSLLVLPVAELDLEARLWCRARLLLPRVLLAILLCFAGCAGIAIPAAMGQDGTTTGSARTQP